MTDYSKKLAQFWLRPVNIFPDNAWAPKPANNGFQWAAHWALPGFGEGRRTEMPCSEGGLALRAFLFCNIAFRDNQWHYQIWPVNLFLNYILWLLTQQNHSVTWEWNVSSPQTEFSVIMCDQQYLWSSVFFTNWHIFVFQKYDWRLFFRKQLEFQKSSVPQLLIPRNWNEHESSI